LLICRERLKRRGPILLSAHDRQRTPSGQSVLVVAKVVASDPNTPSRETEISGQPATCPNRLARTTARGAYSRARDRRCSQAAPATLKTSRLSKRQHILPVVFSAYWPAGALRSARCCCARSLEPHADRQSSTRGKIRHLRHGSGTRPLPTQPTASVIPRRNAAQHLLALSASRLLAALVLLCFAEFVRRQRLGPTTITASQYLRLAEPVLKLRTAEHISAGSAKRSPYSRLEREQSGQAARRVAAWTRCSVSESAER
jgi:hypothetical protein